MGTDVTVTQLTEESTHVATGPGSHPARAYVTSCNEGKTWLVHLMHNYGGLYIKFYKAVSSEKEAIYHAEWVVGNTEEQQ